MAKPLPNPVALRLDELANEVRALRAAVEAMGGGGQVSASHQPDPAPVDLTPILEAIAGTSAIAEAARLEANAAHQHAAALREELAAVRRDVAGVPLQILEAMKAVPEGLVVVPLTDEHRKALAGLAESIRLSATAIP
jgi:hypothetical protein